MYEAIVCRIRTSVHPNANKLLIGDAAGYSVMVGIDTADGELGVLFPEGGCLSPEFCLANGLYRKDPVTGEALGGYLDEAGRVRALKLRGGVSEGLWLPLAALHLWLSKIGATYTTSPVFAEGDRITEIAGHRLCEKYLTPATRRAIAAHGAGSPQARASMALPRHYDTAQLRDLNTVPASVAGTVAIITEKVHGTSGRTGRVAVDVKLGWLARTWNWMVPKSIAVPSTKFEYISGTRNCVLVDDAPGEKGQNYRRQVHDNIVEAGLVEGEVWYYEIAGYDTNGRPIMATHSVESIGDAKLEGSLRKEFGSSFVYDYGTDEGEHRVFVYRITEGDRELTYSEIVERLRGTGFEVVPKLAEMIVPEGPAGAHFIRQTCARIANDPAHTWAHPREGVCVRFESDGEVLSRAYKHKGFVFCALEGIARNDAEYVDVEEVA